jgi:hypothetical protein
MRNGGWLYLDNHLEKLSKSLFLKIRILLLINITFDLQVE